MKIKDLKNELKNLSSEQKDALILDLFKNLKDVKNFLAIKYGDGTKKILFEEAKEKIKKEFDLKYINSRGKFSVAKKYIGDYKKVSGDINGAIKLYIFYLKVLLNLMSEVGNREQLADTFYNTFNQVVKLINSGGYGKNFIKEMKEVSYEAGGHGRGVDAVSDLLDDIIL